MKIYFKRSALYVARIAIILVVVFTVMVVSGTSRVGAEQLIQELFLSQRGALLLGALLILAVWYPRLGYTKVSIKVNMSERRVEIDNAFASCDYEFESLTDGLFVFRSKSVLTRLLSLGEDRVELSQLGDEIVLDGRRKNLSKIELRIRLFLKEQ